MSAPLLAAAIPVVLAGALLTPSPTAAKAPHTVACVSLSEVFAVDNTPTKWRLEHAWGIHGRGDVEEHDRVWLVITYPRCGHLADTADYYVEVRYRVSTLRMDYVAVF